MIAGAVAERILLALWVGTVWAVGYLAVPAAFIHFDDNIVAGAYAGRLFTLVNYVGFACGIMLLIRYFLLGKAFLVRWRFWLVAVMVILVAVLQFYFQAEMAEIKLSEWRQDPSLSARFDFLHQASTGVYLALSVLGLALVVTTDQGGPDGEK